MFGVAKVLVSEPALLLMDEPSSGLAPAFAKQVIEVLKTSIGQDTALLLAGQNVAFLPLADWEYLIDGGRVRLSGTQAEPKLRRRLIVVMLACFMAINFADKAVIGLTAGHIMKDLHLSPQSFGLVGSSFFLLFSLTALIVGFIANRVRSYVILLVLSLVWCAAQIPVAFVASLPVLLGSRILLGAGEGPAFPMALHAAFTWFHDKERNFPAAIVQQGVNIGLMGAGPILTFIMIRYDWHAAFLFLAIIGLVWAVIWAFIGGDGDVADTQHEFEQVLAKPIGTLTLITDPTCIALIFVYFMEYAMVALYFTWLPSYLHRGLGFSEVETGWLFGAISAA